MDDQFNPEQAEAQAPELQPEPEAAPLEAPVDELTPEINTEPAAIPEPPPLDAVAPGCEPNYVETPMQEVAPEPAIESLADNDHDNLLFHLYQAVRFLLRQRPEPEMIAKLDVLFQELPHN